MTGRNSETKGISMSQVERDNADALPPPLHSTAKFPRTLLRRKLGLTLLSVVLLISAPFAIRGWNLRKFPDVQEPFDLVTLGTVPVKPEENAFESYAQAIAIARMPRPLMNDLLAIWRDRPVNPSDIEQ